MSNAFLEPVGSALVTPERTTVTSHSAGWCISSPGKLEVVDAAFDRTLFTAEFEGCGSSSVSDSLDYVAVSLRDRAQLRSPNGSIVWEFRHDGWPEWGTGSAYWDSATETFAFTQPGADSDRWCLVREGIVVETVELTGLTAGGSHVSRSRSGYLGLSMGAGQDGCAVYWVDPSRLGEQPNPLVYEEEVVLDVGHDNSIVTLTHEMNIMRVRSAVASEPISISSDEIDSSLDEFEPFQWVIGTEDGLLVCAGAEEMRIFAADTADLGSWTKLEAPDELRTDTYLVGGGNGSCVSYDWPSGVVRLWRLV
ncbi:hypothetical protein QM716_25360 [Rhodococcus sp. IEGM 1409]|uniref:hypothetical protein n=1 Tax=Rhodococcus sp. IEGM 1409 TaxID=3047082 RepID=UPI0024B79C98|nr:hypothetical protein [Rhodococcus sp. IEGM 1409]MDI9903189.1 hypothetical protein [Rhodococcus sp. IEGM 1409]